MFALLPQLLFVDLVLEDVLVNFDDADFAAVDDQDTNDVFVGAIIDVVGVAGVLPVLDVFVAVEVVNVEVVDVDVVVVVSHPLHVLSH